MIAQLQYSTIVIRTADGAFSTAWMVPFFYSTVPFDAYVRRFINWLVSNKSNWKSSVEWAHEEEEEWNEYNKNIYTFRQKFLLAFRKRKTVQAIAFRARNMCRWNELEKKKDFVWFLQGMIVVKPQNRLRIKLEPFRND